MTQEEFEKILKLHKKWLINKKGGVRADLSNTDLSFTDLRYADLRDANLSNADLSEVNLYGANLEGADLSGANLEGAELECANLIGTLSDEKEQIRKGIVLKEPMTGYKKCRNGIIVTLEIPKGAVVFSINNDKCRTNKAKVIDISNNESIAFSYYDGNFKYEIGKEIEIEDFNMQYNSECTTGIHFYRTKEEAENY